jgi:hypothetical protein
MPRMKVRLEPPFENPEYSPAASACQMSTAAFLIGLQVEAFSTRSFSVSSVPGWPSRMSRRTFSFAM